MRKFHVMFFSKNLPIKIAIYFHDLNENDIRDIKLIIKFFKYLNYEFCNISEFGNNINNKKKHIAITFDDGFSSWTKILKLFENEEITATFYLNSIFFEEKPSLEKFYKNINSNGYEKLINLTELNQIISMGHEIGSHTHSHHTLSSLSEEDFEYEVSKNIEFLDQLNIELNSFAIPFGMRRYLKKSQFNHLNKIFDTVCFGEPGMLFNQNHNMIQRYPWVSSRSFTFNIQNICTDSSKFNNLTKRSGLG